MPDTSPDNKTSNTVGNTAGSEQDTPPDPVVRGTCLRCSDPVTRGPNWNWTGPPPERSIQCGPHSDPHITRADLLTAAWDTVTEQWQVSARASVTEEWTTFEGPEEELGSLLGMAQDHITTSGTLSESG